MSSSGKNICSYKEVSYTTQFGYLAGWEASEVLTSIGHWDTYGLSWKKKKGTIWVNYAWEKLNSYKC